MAAPVMSRYWETIRHLRLRQMVSRVRLRASARARRSWPERTAASYRRRVERAGLVWRGLESGTAAAILRNRSGVSGGLPDVRRGQFTFLNERADAGWPPDWRARAQSQLWRYHLHYFDVLGDLADDPSRTFALIHSWITDNPVHGQGATPDAWHPYVVSLRMVNWIAALSASAAEIPAAIRESLAEHAVFLERNLETDVGGNHLLKNLKAMTVAGCAWSGRRADEWRQRFGAGFADELDRQLLADGAHYERAPMYHCQVMADAIETARVLAPHADPVSTRLLTAIARMDRHLETVTHPDGGIALFNDSAFGMTAAPRDLHRAAAEIGAVPPPPADAQTSAASSGYVTLPPANAARFMLADVGAVCPDDLPAHAHADLLSFELSLDGKRMIVDSGVGEYQAGPWRDYYRSTRAHNTVSVDNAEQSDCWGSFRVGHRARPVNVSMISNPGAPVLQAEHTGFDRLPGGVRHRRRFTWSEGSWRIEDTLLGSGRHAWASFCHLHPDARVIAQDDSSIRIERDGTFLDVRWHGFGRARLARGEDHPLQGWYADRFGPAAPATVLVLEGEGPLPAEFGYALIPG